MLHLTTFKTIKKHNLN